MPSPVIPLFKPGDLEAIEAAGAPPVAPAVDLAVAPAPGSPGYVAPIQHDPVEGPVHRPDLEPPPAAAPPQGGVAAQDAANADLRTALGEQDAAKAAISTATADQDAARAAYEKERIERQVAHDEEAARHMRRAKSDVQESRRQAESEPWTTLQSTRSVGGKILQAIGLLATGVSWNSNHVNRGIEVLKEAENEHFALQKEKHAALFKAVDDAEAGVKDLDAQQMHEMAQLQTREAARWSAIAAKTGAAISAAKGRYDTAVLKQVHAEALSKSGEAHDNAEKAEATASHLDAQTAKLEAETAEIGPNAEANRKYKEAQARYRELKNKRGTGGGGSTDALSQFAERAGQLAAGDPIPTELIALGRKAGLKPNQIATEADRYRGSGAKASKVDLQGKKIEAGMENTKAAMEATDAKGKVIGEWKDVKSAGKGNQQIQRFHRVEERLKELISDVEKHGERIDFDPKQQVRRQSLAEAVAAALRPYNELSSTDASMRAERAILGPTGAFGHGWTMGADLKTLKHILTEAQGQQAANLNTLLRSGSNKTGASEEGSKPDRVVGGITYGWTGTGWKAK